MPLLLTQYRYFTHVVKFSKHLTVSHGFLFMQRTPEVNGGFPEDNNGIIRKLYPNACSSLREHDSSF